MSITLMAAAWELPIPSTEKMVLMCLCDYANDDGSNCWPSVPTLARKCSKGERTVQGAIQSLERLGYLTATIRSGTSSSYQLNPRTIMAKRGPEYHHYVYRIDDLTSGFFYIGARSCLGAIEDDEYMGSGNWVKSARSSGNALSKTVLEILDSREELADAELRHVEPHFGHPDCKNEKLPTPGTLSPLTPAKSAPRKICAPQKTTETPAESAPKPPRTTSNGLSNDKPKRASVPKPFEVTEGTWRDYTRQRKKPVTDTALRGLKREADKAGWTLEAALIEATERGWEAFKADWVKGKANGGQVWRDNGSGADKRSGLARAIDRELQRISALS